VINSPYIVDGADLCRCGKRRGLHRYGDEACPNRLWTCGNGHPQWLTIYYQPANMNATRVRANNMEYDHAAT
jgi:hypothetical protein